MPKGQYIRTQLHRDILIKRNKDPKFRKKISKALMGHYVSLETIKKMRDNAPDFTGDKNPNWRGDKVGKIGIHIWLRKNFIKKRMCEFCGFKSTHPLKIDWALIKGKEYQRKRENFMELCRSCHAKYDRKGFCKK